MRQEHGIPNAADERARRPFRMSRRAGLAAVLTVVLIGWLSVLLMVQGSVSWWWALPWAATLVSVFSYFRQRTAHRAWVGVGWACAQAVFGIGAFCLVVLPART